MIRRLTHVMASLRSMLERAILGVSAEEIRYTIADVRAEIRATRAELMAEIAALRSELERATGREGRAGEDGEETGEDDDPVAQA